MGTNQELGKGVHGKGKAVALAVSSVVFASPIAWGEQDVSNVGDAASATEGRRGSIDEIPNPTTPSSADENDNQDWNHPSRKRLPEYMKWKRRMAQSDIDDKNVGRYFTGIPIAMFDTNKGLGLGGRVLFHDNGQKDSPYFEYTPYRHGTYLQALATTGGWQLHKLDYDAPYLGDSPYRLRASVQYERNTEATYFGVGSATMRDLFWTGSGRSYSTVKTLERDLRAVQPNGIVGSAYHRYDLECPAMNLSLERDFFGSRVRVLVGTTVRHVRVATYDGKSVKGDNPVTGQNAVRATQGPTLLSEQCASGQIFGCNGGWDNVIKLAITLDTRDFEPDPNTGVFMGLSTQVSSTTFGSTSTYGRVSATVRGFFSPLRKVTDLVLAGRVTYQMQSQKTPFFSMPTLTAPDADEEGLGGLRSLRGYQQNRFVGPVLSFANVEVRWMPVKFRVAKQHFGIGVVPFLDMGRVYDRVELKFDKWRFGYGAGLRFAWNQATIVLADYGISSEDQSFSMNFGHTF